jgi:hypothetical protein
MQVIILEDGTEICPVHYFVNGRIACTPGLREFHACHGRPYPWQRTVERKAVSCPACKETEAFKCK